MRLIMNGSKGVSPCTKISSKSPGSIKRTCKKGSSMSRKHHRNSPAWQWEQALIAAYYDMQYHRVLDPLYEKFQQWKAGELAHEEIYQAIHEVRCQNQQLYSFFTQCRAMSAFMYQT